MIDREVWEEHLSHAESGIRSLGLKIWEVAFGLGQAGIRAREIPGLAPSGARVPAGEKGGLKWLEAELEGELRWLEQAGAGILTPESPDWPREFDLGLDSPSLITVQGELPPGPRLVVVGPRAAGHSGLAAARELGRWAGAHGVPLVSGGARGVDGAAHQGALEQGGRTVVVMGTGLSRTYPAEHRELFLRAAGSGALISELPPRFGGRAWTFVRRNRLIAALGSCVVLVEPRPGSGSLTTAMFALKYGKKVLTVPGKKGTDADAQRHSLFPSQVDELENPDDLTTFLSESGTYQPGLESRRVPTPSPRRQFPEDELGHGICVFLGEGRRHLEDLLEHLQGEPGQVCGRLLELELDGFIVEFEPNLYMLNRGVGPEYG